MLTPAPDNGTAVRLAIRGFLGLAAVDESLPHGAASQAVALLRARGHKITEAYLSQLLAGKRPFTARMRAILEKA